MSEVNPSATVIGAGVWGVTLASWAGGMGTPVRLWSSNAEKVQRLAQQRSHDGLDGEVSAQVFVTSDLEEALQPEMLLLAVPPAHVRGLVERMAPLLRPEHRIVHGAKGFCADGRSVSQVIRDHSCVLRTGALAGPVAPLDLWRGEDCAAVIASPFSSLIDEVCEFLAHPQLRIYGSLDLMGVEVGGAMWAPVALAAGMISGAGLGRALPAVLLTRAIVEAGRLSIALGGTSQTLSGLAGVGDWMRAVNDPDDALVSAGAALALHPGHCQHKEAASRVATLLSLAERHGVDMPITRAVHEVIDGRPLAEALAVLMDLPTGLEGH